MKETVLCWIVPEMLYLQVEKVKFLIKTLAKLGMNVLMPYTEDTYEVAGNG